MTQPNSWSLKEAVKKALDDFDYNKKYDYQGLEFITSRLCAEIESNFACPHVVSSDEGTSHCELAESSSIAHEAEMAKIGNNLVKAESSVKDLQAALAEKEKRLEKLQEELGIIRGMRHMEASSQLFDAKIQLLKDKEKIKDLEAAFLELHNRLNEVIKAKDDSLCKTTENTPTNQDSALSAKASKNL